MKTRNNLVKFIKNYTISIVFLTLISAVVLYLLYNFEMRNIYISNSIFIPNMIIFVISIGVNVGAGNVFNPLNYFVKRILFKKRNPEDRFISYVDYTEQKEKPRHVSWFLTYASFTMLLVALIFTLIV